MAPPRAQMTLMAWLVLVASVAVVIWLFQRGAAWGVFGLLVAKHVVIAYLCHVLGVDRAPPAKAPAPARTAPAPPS